MGIILITHDMHLALEYADSSVVLSGGRVIARDYIDKILADASIISRANLKHTSIERMGRLYGVEDLSALSRISPEGSPVGANGMRDAGCPAFEGGAV